MIFRHNGHAYRTERMTLLCEHVFNGQQDSRPRSLYKNRAGQFFIVYFKTPKRVRPSLLEISEKEAESMLMMAGKAHLLLPAPVQDVQWISAPIPKDLHARLTENAKARGMSFRDHLVDVLQAGETSRLGRPSRTRPM